MHGMWPTAGSTLHNSMIGQCSIRDIVINNFSYLWENTLYRFTLYVKLIFLLLLDTTVRIEAATEAEMEEREGLAF